MKNFYYAILLSLWFQLMGCRNSAVMGHRIYNEGDCLQEIDRQYIAKPKDPDLIYRVDKVDDQQYYVSTYYASRWVDLRDRPLSYFKKTERFDYSIVSCPGGKAIRSISNAIDLNKMKK